MDDGSKPRHAPKHMPGPGAGGAPQYVRDAALEGDATATRNRPNMGKPGRVTPSSARGGFAGGGMAIPALLLVVVILALCAVVLL